jgi:HSP20 family protein
MSQIAVQKKEGGPVATPIARREFEPFRLMREMLGWDPFREMTPLWQGEVSTFSPAFEVKESKDSFLFKADVPGIKESDLEVTSAGNRLTVAGKRQAETEQKEETYYAYERSYGSFTRTFTLPDEADAEHCHAELRHGVLTVVIPKRASAVAKRIAISPGDKPKS